MARDPGEWYEEQRQKAERLSAELAGARQVVEAAQAVVRRLERLLEEARYVGD
jgi:hypothetical protein